MSGEAEKETAAATGRAVLRVTSYRKPPLALHTLARGDKADPETLVVSKGELITSQPVGKVIPIFLPLTLSTLFDSQRSKLPSPLNSTL